MKLAVILAVGGLLVAAGPALAQPASCERPTAPAPVNGAALNLDQLSAAKKSVTDFIAASDAYQGCLIDSLNAQREAAKAAKIKFDKSIADDVNKKISANQADKESVGKSFNEAVKAYKAANPA